MDRKMLETLYDLKRCMLRPDYTRLAEAQHIKRNPDTDEISWPPSCAGMVDQLRHMGLIL